MASQVDICNRALLSIGARATVSSINPSDGSTQANACAILFTPTFEALARSAQWNCLRKQVTLSLLAAAPGTPENPNGTTMANPPTPWLYEYSYPADCLRMSSIVPSLPFATGANVPMTTSNNCAPTNLNFGGQILFQVQYNTDSSGNPIITILTDQTQAQAIYTVNQPNPVIWDSQFQAAMVASLAAYLVPALSLNLKLSQMAAGTAQKLIEAARITDGNEGVTIMDHVPDWIRARGYNAGWTPGYCAGLYGWDTMAWPS